MEIKSMTVIVLHASSTAFLTILDAPKYPPLGMIHKLLTLLINTFRGLSMINPYIPIIVTALTVDESITTYF